MTVWEQWLEELKEIGKDAANKKLIICNCGLYDRACTNRINGTKCPLYNLDCHDYKKVDDYLESEVQ